MTAEEVKALPIAEKVLIMEAIWDDFRDRFDKLDVPQRQKDLWICAARELEKEHRKYWIGKRLNQ